MSKPNAELRLHPSLQAAAGRFASADGASLNQFVNLAVAENLSALETESCFRKRAGKADRDAFLRFLDEVGTAAPASGDEMPPARDGL